MYTIKPKVTSLLADTLTPVSIYLKIREKYGQAVLLESSDYHGDEDIFSYICFDPIAEFKIEDNVLSTSHPTIGEESISLTNDHSIPDLLNKFASSFTSESLDLPFVTSGLFGYTAYDGVRYFEDIEIDTYPNSERKIPDLFYRVFRYVLVFNHFNNRLYIIQNDLEEIAHFDEIKKVILSSPNQIESFKKIGQYSSNFTDDEFIDLVEKGKKHCKRGDVFQIVLSRRFQQSYQGDDFNIYRSLRSVNPSPYLFYFDFGDFRLMGSSPEAQIVVNQGKATIYPIAGTFKRTGDDKKDKALAEQLLDDPKENSEHVMLVDLARNDLSRHCHGVKVDVYKEAQYYSHVIHLVSKVTGELEGDSHEMNIVADTFPAGTLSGAPKHQAMSLINKYENGNRGFYGGAIGYIGFNGDFNHAIMIRSALSKDGKLFYQAGAGVVDLSVHENEKQEVYNKLGAVMRAIDLAEEIKVNTNQE